MEMALFGGLKENPGHNYCYILLQTRKGKTESSAAFFVDVPVLAIGCLRSLIAVWERGFTAV